MKRFATLLLALVMILSLAAPVFAQEVDSEAGGSATITISNASKGETYAVYKLFDATVTGTEDGSIAYTGTIPESLKDYFVADNVGNITATDAAMEGDKMSQGLQDALKAWTKTQTATASAESDGTVLEFSGLLYGYYVVTTTQGEQAITVTSTNPNANIIDKNKTPPVSNQKKEANDEEYFIGETITYTISFNTATYDGTDQIISYTIKDTLPEFLANVTVTEITIGGAAYTVNGAVPQFDDNGEITIPWVDANNQNLYENGAEIKITYTAVLADGAAIDGTGNTNKVTITYETTEGEGGDEYTTDETIYTYAIALKKVDQSGNPLAGATFQLPFYVKAAADTDGAFIYAGTNAGDGLINTLTTPDDGVIIIKGVEQGTYFITETVAPNGYNKLTADVEVTAVKTSATTTNTTVYLDENGNVVSTEEEANSTVTVEISKLAATAVVVVNKTGSELPSTGGMGTTMFYMVGGIMVLAAVVLLVTKKRMTAV